MRAEWGTLVLRSRGSEASLNVSSVTGGFLPGGKWRDREWLFEPFMMFYRTQRSSSPLFALRTGSLSRTPARSGRDVGHTGRPPFPLGDLRPRAVSRRRAALAAAGAGNASRTAITGSGGWRPTR
ncbi:hypothetical protein GCM10009560_42510 [Nonomuraea longicatena]|uniref:Uncharacterized protein n=1 Tax=Nonomuraea longicatena TaxID=83682 RepID=A0ABN1PY43_9ACTN